MLNYFLPPNPGAVIRLVILLTCLQVDVCSQVPSPSEDFEATQLEELAESAEGETDNDYESQQLEYFAKHPVSLNGTVEELQRFPMFNSLLLENLLQYRKLLGDFVSIYELQAVAGFTPDLLRQMEPYLTISNGGSLKSDLRSQLKSGKSTLAFRPSINLQPLKGFITDDPDGRFQGDRLAIFLRYRYQYRQTLQYGFTAEKDAGEKMLHPGSNLPFDFQSFHFFVRGKEKIKTLAIGDFTVNLGQGLMVWQSQAFKKTAQVLNTKRQGEVLRPYHSAGEHLFLRGVAGTFRTGRVQTTLFLSQRQLSANTQPDSLSGVVITSFQTSGLHRTVAELHDRHTVRHRLVGANIKYSFPRWQTGMNFVSHHYSHPVKKNGDPYNIYAIQGSTWLNLSLDFSGTYRNFHFFGEWAADRHRNFALVSGLIASLDKRVDWSLHIRKIDPGYQSIFGNAFTESSLPQNETGVYTGFTIRPISGWAIDTYADIFYFRWLKYRSDAPASGSQYFFQVTWKPSRNTELYSRVRYRSKPVNTVDPVRVDYPEEARSINWRSHLNHSLSRSICIRKRAEFCTYRQGMAGRAYGYLLYFDLLFKPVRRSYSFNTRLLFFESENYDTRIYAYENDLPFISSTPSFFGSGLRWYSNVKCRIRFKFLKNSNLVIAGKVGTTLFQQLAGTHPPNKTEFKFQGFLSPRS